jgi:hypothetical protein
MSKCTDNLTLGEIKELMSIFNKGSSNQKEFITIGKKYFIRTVTMYYVGQLKDFSSSELLLEQASWIPDTGRFHDALRDGKFSEVEPFINDVLISRGSIIDITEWSHKLPKDQE